jgi:hypothetical protein
MDDGVAGIRENGEEDIARKFASSGMDLLG